MSYSIKIHKTYRAVVAICDIELVGKTFQEGERVLEVPERFYSDEVIGNEKEMIKLMVDLAKEDSTFNIIGDNSVKAAIKAGIIRKDGTKMVDGIPFALVLL